MRYKIIVKIVIIAIMLITINNSFSYDHCKASYIKPKFYVDNDYNENTAGWGYDHFNNITEALLRSWQNYSGPPGNRIIVYNGTYTERIVINHTIDLFGEDKEITTINGNNIGDVIQINASNVNISHLTIKNCGSNDNNAIIKINSGSSIITDNNINNGTNAIIINNCDNHIIYDNSIEQNSDNGIYLYSSDSNSIRYNEIYHNSNGISLYSSYSNTIKYNQIKHNTLNGLFFNDTCNLNVEIENNNISHNTKNGIFLSDHCDYNYILTNDIYSNGDSGIRVENSSYNTFYNNEVIKNENYGILTVGSDNIISYNRVNYNDEHGVFFFADSFNTLQYNTIKYNNKNGVHLSNSTNDTILSNKIIENNQYGIYLDFFSSKNKIVDNLFLYNSINALDKSDEKNIWNIEKYYFPNIILGENISGNYWSNFDETDEGADDINGDNVSDDPYQIYNNNYDNSPILDSIPPEINIASSYSSFVYPSQQTLGSSTLIIANITDNVEVKSVIINVTKPDNTQEDFTVTSSKSGNIYSLTNTFTMVGTYNFTINVNDPRNQNTTEGVSFWIKEGTPPTVTDNSPTIGYPAELFFFNATVTDDQDSAEYLKVYANYSHGTLSGSLNLTNEYGNFFRRGLTLDRSISQLTYYYYVLDRWGNADETETKTVTMIDNIAPEIDVILHNYSTDGTISNYTVGARITDNAQIANATIEYWYSGTGHLTSDMDFVSTNYYEKVIYLDNLVDVYCIIYAEDYSGNSNNSMSPYANASGPYNGIVGLEITFDASESFDLDGNITDYSWDFGDGTTGSGVNIGHEYLTNGEYTVILTVTDDEANTGQDSTTTSIIKSAKNVTDRTILNKINNYYEGISLTQLFYAYDSDADNVVDTFVDPNNVLKTIPIVYVNCSGYILFPLSIDDTQIPEFLWNASPNKICNITHKKVTVTDNDFDYNSNEEAWVNITVNKTDWIIIEVNDKFVNGQYNITTNNRTIDRNYTWRNNNKIYFLDDADTNYTIHYNNIYEDVSKPTFSPNSGSIINENRTTITITYNIDVTIDFASFGDLTVTSDILKLDGKTYSYTPPGDLESDMYTFEIHATAVEGGSQDQSSALYELVTYILPPTPPEQSLIEKFMWLLALLSLVGGCFVTIFLMKQKGITFQSWVYIKNKKIIPFFKPVILGPLKLDINEKNISKVEFYLNGKLKETLNQPPYIWNWDEPSFMRQKIEAKVYDDEGNTNSTGEMTFFIFNPPKNL